ncbi:hypothetical protein FGO68_gene6611 [Halteria grandinella]|uniref:Uncharacterized protein n=1 Tax=Halteria grandinella TaxID=5974 RepID=A0A8J8NJI0_HALGN|nr:hypothetical protein FGO68_gene6611 [Halteria grandinella]
MCFWAFSFSSTKLKGAYPAPCFFCCYWGCFGCSLGCLSFFPFLAGTGWDGSKKSLGVCLYQSGMREYISLKNVKVSSTAFRWTAPADCSPDITSF